MPAHSIRFSRPECPLPELLERLTPALERVGVRSGRSYTLLRQDPEHNEIDLFLARNDVDAASLVGEDLASFNRASVSFWIGTMEFLLSYGTLRERATLAFTFMGDALRNPGPAGAAQLMLATASALELPAAVLLSAGAEEEQMDLHQDAGKGVLEYVTARLTHAGEAAPPFLALVREDRVSDEMRQGARTAGLDVRRLLGGYMAFSSVDDVE